MIDRDAQCVLVRVDLRPSTYQAIAARVGADHVAQALSILADRAVTPKGRKKYTRLTPQDRATIRHARAGGATVKELAARFGVAEQTIRNVP
ncbi:helix-turn-helix domain-containing protein [Microbacterium lacticum]|uniref:helix-turn-helix domain-containing protein n=1 Tax=Microbacterium lacticum TaxID=33885 RepID=UPI001F55BD3C|nr:helix-turn-helix domain-containing protein [Microbacterium lacticum]